MRNRAPVWMPRTKATQGFDANIQYAAVNAGRCKRQKRAERNQQVIMSGGYKQVPLINLK